jgi:hypothetical protein
MPRKSAAQRKTPETITRVPPVAPSPDVNAAEMQIQQENVRTFKPGTSELSPREIIVQDKPVDMEKLANLAFMEEMVTVHIHSTNNPTDEQTFELFNNGRREVFRRNEQKTVKRYFVDGLARAKPTTFTQHSKRDNAGEMQEYQQPHTGLKYPFSVIRDDNPKGADWLRWAMAQQS